MGMLNDMMNGGQPAPEQGQPSQGGGAQALIKKATQLLYAENFENMVQMFQQHGKEGFPQAMAIAINGVLDRLEQEQGQPLDAQTAAEVGVALFEILLQDLSEGGVLPDIDKQDVLKSIESTLKMWAQNHPDQANPEEMKQVIGQMAQQMGATGQVATPSEAPAGMPPQGA